MKRCILLFLVIPLYGYSQCEDHDKLDFGGTLESKSRNHIPFDLNISDTIKYCCDAQKIKPYSDFVVSKAKEFIIARSDEAFYEKLEINQIDVNYPDSVKIAYSKQSLYHLSNYNISYWITYTYSNNDIGYGFGLEFNKDGEMISENKFPDFAKNKGAENLISVCNALDAVRRDERFAGKTVELVELSYLDAINSFCWLVKEEMGPMKCGSHNYTVNLFYVNANTTNLELVKQKQGVVIVDCFESRRRPKKQR